MDEPQPERPLVRSLRRTLAEGRKSDPWPEEVGAALDEATAVPLCTNCLFPEEGFHWFCPHCAFPTGDCVAVNPYLQIFVSGECLRRGVMGPPEQRLGPQLFLALYAVNQYTIFAPVYWFWMIRRAVGKPICAERRVPIAPLGAENPVA